MAHLGTPALLKKTHSCDGGLKWLLRSVLRQFGWVLRDVFCLFVHLSSICPKKVDFCDFSVVFDWQTW
jgi:hypothetical protein